MNNWLPAVVNREEDVDIPAASIDYFLVGKSAARNARIKLNCDSVSCVIVAKHARLTDDRFFYDDIYGFHNAEVTSITPEGMLSHWIGDASLLRTAIGQESVYAHVLPRRKLT